MNIIKSHITKKENTFGAKAVLLTMLIVIGIGLAGQALTVGLGKSNVYADTSSDTTYRWGAFGLSSKTNNESDVPVNLSNLSSITAIAAGNASDMALDSNGNVWTWGDNSQGELGDGNTTNQPTNAVEVSGLPTIVQIAEAYNTDVAIAANGTVWGWGYNGSGELCTGNFTEHLKPFQISALSGVSSAAGAGPHILYLLSNGTIEACGGNQKGELGNGTLKNSAVPVAVTGLPAPAVSVSAGQVESTALLNNGQVWDWGYNHNGQLGDGNSVTSDVPVMVNLPSAAKQVYMGGDDYTNGQSLALLTNGQVWGWGSNSRGQLGDGKKKNSNVPVQATSLPSGVTFTYVVSGGSHSLSLDSNGNVWAWGDNSEGEIGNGHSKGVVLTPVQVLSGADMISATADDSVAHVAAQ